MIVVVHLPLLPLRVALIRAGHPFDAPAALAPAPDGPQVVGQCTPAALACGVHEGLRAGEAFARCPQLALIRPNPEEAADTVERMLCALEAAGCAVEPLGQDGAAFDARPVMRLHGGLRGVLARVRAAVPVGVDGRIGVAPTLFAAHQAARAAERGAPLVLDAADVVRFLAPLPAERLPLPDRAVEACRDVGLRTVGQIAALPHAAALEKLGFAGVEAWELARGLPGRPPRPRTPPAPLSAQMEFPDPSGTLGSLESAGRLLLEEIAAAVRATGGAVRMLRLGARLADGGSWGRGVALRDATADPARLELAVLPRLAEIPAPITRLRIEADASGGAGGHQLTAIPAPGRERMARAGEAVRQVRAALGDEALLRVVELEADSRIPERRWALAPHPEPAPDRP